MDSPFTFNQITEISRKVKERFFLVIADSVKSLEDERTQFLEEKKVKEEGNEEETISGNSIEPPWACSSEEIKSKILQLSQFQNVFTSPPKGEVEKYVNIKTIYSQAKGALKNDPELEKIRFELVPKKINEETFWVNYFYRVALLQETNEVDILLVRTDKEKKALVNMAENPIQDISEKEVLFEEENSEDLVEIEELKDSKDGSENIDEEWMDTIQTGLSGVPPAETPSDVSPADDESKDLSLTPKSNADWEEELRKELSST